MYFINGFMIYFTCKSNSFVLISVVSSQVELLVHRIVRVGHLSS